MHKGTGVAVPVHCGDLRPSKSPAVEPSLPHPVPHTGKPPPPHPPTHTLRGKGLAEGRRVLWAVMVEGRSNVSSFLHIYITVLLTKRDLLKRLGDFLIT